MYPTIADCSSNAPLNFDRLRNEIVTSAGHAASFCKDENLQRQIDMLEQEFSGQLRLKFVHAVLNVLLRRGISTRAVYAHFQTLWAEHANILLDTLDSRWLLSACDTVCDYSADPAEAQAAVLISLFANTLRLAETERLMCAAPEVERGRLKGWTPLFDGLTAFMPGSDDTPANLMRRLELTLKHENLAGIIGRELISRALSADTVFARLSRQQVSNLWRPYITPIPMLDLPAPRPKPCAAKADTPSYILLNDTGRLGGSFHLGTMYACESLRQSLSRRGLQEIGWANDRKQWDSLFAAVERNPDLIVLNGEGTLHHGAKRAIELLSLCSEAKAQGIRVAVLNSVWEANPDTMSEALSKVDLVHVRDNLSGEALPPNISAEITPDMSIQLFRQIISEGKFLPPQYDIGVMDSVVPVASKALLAFSEEESLPFYVMPGGNLRSMRLGVEKRSGPVWPRLLQITDVTAARGWVTGRFHGLVAALSAGIPVCALSSNTSKIEGLLRDAGLAEACLLDPEWMSETNKRKRDEVVRRFEMQNDRAFVQRREIYLEQAVQRIDKMFDQTAGLAQTAALARDASPNPSIRKAIGRLQVGQVRKTLVARFRAGED